MTKYQKVAKALEAVGGYELYVDKRAQGHGVKFIVLCDAEDAVELVKDVISRAVPEATIVRGYKVTHGGPEVAMLTITFRE